LEERERKLKAILCSDSEIYGGETIILVHSSLNSWLQLTWECGVHDYKGDLINLKAII